MNSFLSSFAKEWQSIWTLIMLISALVHILFAGAVARDGGRLLKKGGTTQLVTPMVWAFATLIGGVPIAAIYWAIHHIQFKTH